MNQETKEGCIYLSVVLLVPAVILAGFAGNVIEATLAGVALVLAVIGLWNSDVPEGVEGPAAIAVFVAVPATVFASVADDALPAMFVAVAAAFLFLVGSSVSEGTSETDTETDTEEETINPGSF